MLCCFGPSLQTGAGGFVIVGEADGGGANGGSGGGTSVVVGDDDLPPDFDAEPMENFEPTASSASKAGKEAPAAGGDDDMD